MDSYKKEGIKESKESWGSRISKGIDIPIPPFPSIPQDPPTPYLDFHVWAMSKYDGFFFCLCCGFIVNKDFLVATYDE